LKDNKGDWVLRNDVWVWTTDGQRCGSLKPGFGSGPWKFGPELGFGWTIGKQLDRQVLLIKTCWGGKSVRRDFLSPRSAQPSLEQLQQELDRAKKNKPDTTIDDVQARYGQYYRRMIGHVRDVLDDIKQHFPDYDESRGYELVGFVWFQGWNDMVDGQQRDEQYASYTTRLAQLIRDVRQDLKAPRLPIVIGELGVGGREGGNPQFRAAQRAVAELPEFQETVTWVETHPFWEPEVEEMVRNNVWRGPEWPKFYNVGSDRGYHYLGSGKMMYQMGAAFAQGMTEIVGEIEP
jgi:alpha-galactosidase